MRQTSCILQTAIYLKKYVLRYLFVQLILLSGVVNLQGMQYTSEIEDRTTGTVTAKALNVRTEQSVNAAVVGKLAYGTQVEILSTHGNWTRIRHQGDEGWVFNTYLNVEMKTAQGWVTAIVLNIRQEPSLNAQVVGQLQRGDQVQILENEDNWYHIEAGRVDGWVHQSFISTSRVVYSSSEEARRKQYLQNNPDLPRVITRAIRNGNFLIGMSMDQIRASLGEPMRIVQKDSTEYNAEQWVYDYMNLQITGSDMASSSRRLYLNFHQNYLTSWGMQFPSEEDISMSSDG